MFTKKLFLFFIACVGNNLIQSAHQNNPRSGTSDTFYNKDGFIKKTMGDRNILDNQSRILKEYLKYIAAKANKNK